jgi:hypothetical protein
VGHVPQQRRRFLHVRTPATITVTPFSLSSGGGTRGTPLSIHLSLVRGSGAVPTKAPTAIPTKAPVTLAPTKAPTKAPVVATVDPTLVSTTTTTPTKAPTKAPVVVATVDPTIVPVTAAPTKTPTKAPVVATVDPTIAPVTAPPTKAPTKAPVVVATVDPTVVPVTMAPTKAPTKAPVATPAPAVPPTNAPVTICPSITEYINSITLSGRTLTANHSAFVPEDRASPEDKALRTLVDADRMSLIDLKPCNARNRFLLLQKFALLTLHHQYKSPSYPWRNSTNWGNMAMDECTWFGIFCTPVSIMDDNGQDTIVQAVTEVRLGRNNLNGYFPPDLALLRHMVTFDIDLNMDMRGTLPSTVYAWTDLKTFIARNVRFPGPMPTALGMWTNLEHLAMSFYGRRHGAVDQNQARVL